MDTNGHEWDLTAENAWNAEREGQKSETNPNGKREIGKPECGRNMGAERFFEQKRTKGTKRGRVLLFA
jgi:hypothetical protein